MMRGAEPKPPRLSSLQKAWLQELGLDRRMLALYGSGPQAAEAAGALGTTEAAGSAGAAAAAGSGEMAAGLAASGAASARRAPPQASGPRSARELLGMPAARPAAPVTAETAPRAAPAGPGREVPQAWDDLAVHIGQCRACGLHEGRSQAVFGSGEAQAPEWLVVGEAPGGYDDRAGLPFQGKAGLLLQAMLASIQVTDRTPVFFTNLIKCRPLGNRSPTPEEIAACLPYVQRQIALLKPRRILALGGLAAQALLGVQDDLEALRGKVHTVRSETGQDIPMVATYHPAALLLRPQHKPDAWQDLNLALAVGGADT